MTPNELVNALSNEATAVNKWAQVLRALDYDVPNGELAAILRDSVATELDRLTVRLIGMFDMALPDDPIAEPAGDVVEMIVRDVAELCWPYDEDDMPFTADELAGILRRRLAQPQQDSAWRIDVCERLGLDCGAGATWSPEEVFRHVQENIAQPQRQGRAVGEIEVTDSYRYASLYDAQNCFLPEGTKLYTEQPASAAVADGMVLVKGRLYSEEVVSTALLGLASDLLAAAPDRSQSGGG